MSEELLDQLIKDIPLKIRIKADIEMFFLNKYGGTFFISLDKDGNENQQQMERNKQIIEDCKPLIEHIFESIDKWKQDGMPE